MKIAQGLSQTIFPQFPRLPANLAGMEGLLSGDADSLANGVVWGSPPNRPWLFALSGFLLDCYLHKSHHERRQFLTLTNSRNPS
jgi:hypothetical protein